MPCYILAYVILTGILAYVVLCQKTKIKASSPNTSGQRDGETMETVTDLIFLAPKSLLMVIAAIKLKDVCSLEEKLLPS